MAVIREKRQFRIGTIGVARASQGGQIVGETIARSANALGDMFYKEAAQAAEKGGMEAGASADREKVITINPETGEPEAYAPPEGMGSIGADAYQRVVMRRFQQSIEDEIQNKGRELAARYQSSPAMYESAMSDYLASMTNVAQDEFRGFITDVGTSYLNATMTNMQIAQVRRERAAARASLETSLEDGLNNLEALTAASGGAAYNAGSIEASLLNSIDQGATDAIEAGLFSETEARNYQVARQQAIIRGTLRNAASRTQDPETLALLQSAIGTQNFNAIPAEFSGVADAMRSLGTNYGAMAEIERFSDGLFSDAIAGAKIIEAREVASIAAEEAQLVFDLQVGAGASRLVATRIASTRGPLYVASHSAQAWQQSGDLARAQFAAGREDVSDQILKDRNDVLRASSRAIYARTLSGLSTPETFALENAISNQNVMLAPESARLELNALMRMEAATGEPILDEFLPHIGSYRSAAGKDIDLMLEAAAAQEALGVNVPSILSSQNLDQDVSDMISQVNAIPNLDTTAAKTLRNSIYANAGSNNLNAFFGNSNLTADQLREAQSVFDGGAAQEGVLTDEQIAQVGQARAYAIKAEHLSELRTTFNRQTAIVTARIAEREAERQENRQIAAIQRGQGTPEQQGDRELTEKFLSEQYGLEPGEMANIWGSSRSMNDPVIQGILSSVTRTHVLPESLHQSMSSLSNGELRIGDPNQLLSVYMNIKDYQFAGQALQNPALSSLSLDQIATLDYLADVVDVRGNVSAEELAEVFARRAEFRDDPRLQARVENVLGGTLDDFVLNLEGIDDVPLSALSAMKDAALELVSLGSSQRDINRRLNAQIERTYPDGDGYVVNQYGGSRTKSALPASVPGNEPVFMDHILRRISEGTGFKNVALGRGAGLLENAAQALRTSFTGGLDFSGKQENFYLVPLDASSNGEVRYTVRRVRPLEDGGDEMVYETISGSLAPFEDAVQASVPLIISTRDPMFTATIEQNRLRAKQEELSSAERPGLLQQQYAEWQQMTRSQREAAGLPTSELGAQIRFMGREGRTNFETESDSYVIRNQERTNQERLERNERYIEWQGMTRSERESAGLPTSEAGAQVFFKRFQHGLGTQ